MKAWLWFKVGENQKLYRILAQIAFLNLSLPTEILLWKSHSFSRLAISCAGYTSLQTFYRAVYL
jgi:hypothetical protein